MRILDIKSVVEQGKDVVIQFKENIHNYVEESVDANMIGKIVGVSEEYLDDNFLTLHINLNDYKTHNQSVAKRDWFDAKGNPTLTWFDSGMYPKDGIVQIVFDKDLDLSKVITFVDDNSLLSEYHATQPQIGYVDWLENMVRHLRKKAQ